MMTAITPSLNASIRAGLKVLGSCPLGVSASGFSDMPAL
jgi:hypothetical protein